MSRDRMMFMSLRLYWTIRNARFGAARSYVFSQTR